MENMISQNTLGVIIQALAAIMVAIITYILGPIFAKKITKDTKSAEQQPPNGQQRISSKSISAIFSGITAALTFIVIGLVSNAIAPKPSVRIISPAKDQSIEVQIIDTGSGSFSVSGISSEVFSDPDLRVYVLVHPADPPAAGWWIQQPATVEQNGQWSTLAWFGSKDFPPQTGDKIDLLVIAATPENVAGFVNIIDPKDVKPAAQSDIIRVTIGALK